jgi:hypothetical protein
MDGSCKPRFDGLADQNENRLFVLIAMIVTGSSIHRLDKGAAETGIDHSGLWWRG